eukprot:1212777-Amorphochlora_amoeboformis.AAC.2
MQQVCFKLLGVDLPRKSRLSGSPSRPEDIYERDEKGEGLPADHRSSWRDKLLWIPWVPWALWVLWVP